MIKDNPRLPARSLLLHRVLLACVAVVVVGFAIFVVSIRWHFYEDLCEGLERAREHVRANALFCGRCARFDAAGKEASSLAVQAAIAANRCPEGALANIHMLVYLRMPKVGSSTMVLLFQALSHRNDYVNNRVAWRQIRNESALVEYMESLPYQTSHANHGPLLNFRYTPATMIHLREPVSRFLSHYDYLRWGPRPFIARVKMRFRNEPSYYYTTLDECIHIETRRANTTNRKLIRSAMLDTCFRDAFWVTLYLCGWDAFCSEKRSPLAHQQALRNLEEKVLIVGLTEQFDRSVAMAEKILPSFFRGATALVKTIPKQRVNERKRSVVTMHSLVKSMLKYEISIYTRGAEIFNAQQRCVLFSQ